MDELTRLFLAARDGDTTALGSAIRASEGEVWRFTAHLVGRVDADDVTQDTFLRVVARAPDFRGDSSARTWLLAIARRSCADWVRRAVRRRRLLDRAAAEATVAAASTTPDGTLGTELDAVIATLDADRRAAFVLTQVLGYSYADAADVCGVPVGTIRSRVARAREHLVEALRAEATG